MTSPTSIYSPVFALVLAGGSGQRLGSPIAKQFLEIEGKPLLMHSLERLANTGVFEQIVLVLPKKDEEYWLSLCRKYQFSIEHTIAIGGESRFHSVKNGLSSIQNTDNETLVAIHDGVRMFITDDFIQKGSQLCREYGNAIPCLKINESLRIFTSDKQSCILDRDKVRTVQTPQFFKYKDIKTAYEMAEHTNFTDDASVYESMGKSLHLFEGLVQNIKITQAFDLKYAEFLLKEGF